MTSIMPTSNLNSSTNNCSQNINRPGVYNRQLLGLFGLREIPWLIAQLTTILFF